MKTRILRLVGLVLLLVACSDSKQRLPNRQTDAARRGAAAADAQALAAARNMPAAPPEVLLVNGESITLDDILEPLRAKLPALARASTPAMYRVELDKRIQKELVDQVETRLIMQAASLDIGNDQIEEALNRAVDQAIKNRINREFDGRVSRFEEELQRSGTSIAQVRTDMRRDILVTTYLKETILPRLSRPTRQELWDYYQQNIDDFTQEASRELLLIDIRFTGDRDAARQTADAALARLQQGEPFESVAREVSTGVHKDEGGAWGAIKSKMRGRYALVSSALFEMEGGQISSVIEAPDAFFIVKVGEIVEEQRTPFKDIQPQLNERYRAVQFERQRRRTLQALLDKAVIEPDAEHFRQALLTAAPDYGAALEGLDDEGQAAQSSP